MNTQDDRRCGMDRRHRFLNGLDRRQSPPPIQWTPSSTRVSKDRQTDTPDWTAELDRWANYEDIPPVE